MAISSVQNYISLRGPQFLSDPRINDFITLATSKTNTKYFPANTILFYEAVGLRVLHYLELERISGGVTTSNNAVTNVPAIPPGIITSESEATVSISYSVSEKDKKNYPDLCKTIYGSELITLMRTHILPVTIG